MTHWFLLFKHLIRLWVSSIPNPPPALCIYLHKLVVKIYDINIWCFLKHERILQLQLIFLAIPPHMGKVAVSTHSEGKIITEKRRDTHARAQGYYGHFTKGKYFYSGNVSWPKMGCLGLVGVGLGFYVEIYPILSYSWGSFLNFSWTVKVLIILLIHINSFNISLSSLPFVLSLFPSLPSLIGCLFVPGALW